MQNRKYIFLLLLIFTFAKHPLYAQDYYHKQAEKLFHEQVYSEAANLYTLLLQENYDVAYNLRLAECYVQMNLPLDAEYWYAMLAAQQPVTDPDILLQYAQLLKLNGKYVSAKEVFLEYAQYNTDGFYLAGTCDYALNNAKKNGLFFIDTLPLNTKFSEIAPAFFGSGILFSSTRTEEQTESTRFYDLYYAENPVEKGTKISKLNSSVNTKVHEASSAYDNFRNELLFTRNNYSKGRMVTAKDKTVNLHLFSAKYNEGKWKPVSEFIYNSKKYSTGQPCLSADGNILLFVSDMPGGFGGTDIYYCVRNNNEWSNPVNMGEVINTKGNEMFPFLSEDGKLYFASDWLPGFGGLDVFMSSRENNHWSKPENLGPPVNTSRDDYAFIIKNGTGYFSSNRIGGKGDDDIYSCTQIKNVSGVFVTDEKNIPLANAAVKIYDGATLTLAGYTNSDGILAFQAAATNSFALQVSHAGFREMQIANVHTIRTSDGFLPIQMIPLMGSDEQTPDKLRETPEKNPDTEPSTEGSAKSSDTNADVYTYELQIGIFSNPDYGKISSLTSFGELSVKSKENGLLSFSIINLLSAEQAEKAKAAAKNNGFSDAYIITYKNGMKQ